MTPVPIGPIPCQGPSIPSCAGVASRFFVRDGVPVALCQACREARLGVVLRGEVSREDYLRLSDVSEVMSS